MKHVWLCVCWIGLILVSAHGDPAAPPAFKDPPSAARLPEGGGAAGVVIRFESAAWDDVEVRIVDAQGRAVRHLAAGRLGKNAPPPLARDSRKQAVSWDGADDQGRPVLGPGHGPFRAVVSLRLSPTLDKVIGNNPADLGGVRALAVGPDGRLYVFHCYGGEHPNDSSVACAVFDRQGKYLRTILPWPADLPDSRLAGIRRIESTNGKAPYIYQPETRSYLPGLGDLPCQRAVATRDGRIGLIGIQEGPRPFAQPGLARLTVVNTDGGVPAGGAAGPLRAVIHPLTDTADGLALSPDEKTVYAVGVRAGLHPTGPYNLFTCDVCDHGGETWQHTIPVPMVFKCGWDDQQVQVVIGGDKPGFSRADTQPEEKEAARRDAQGKRLIEPVSVATDADGNIYVADVAADAIVVVTQPDPVRGHVNFIKRIAIRRPQRVEVSKRTGAIYVLAGGPPDRDLELVKLAGLANPKIVAKLTVATRPERERDRDRELPPNRRPIIALDDNADLAPGEHTGGGGEHTGGGAQAIIWIGQPFWRVEDQGDRFGVPLDMRDPARTGEKAFAAVMEMSVDRVHGWLYVNNTRRMNTATGEWEKFKTAGGGMWPSSYPGSANGNAGRDGNYYVDTGAGGAMLYRYGPDLTFQPFEKGNDKGGKGLIHGLSRNRGVGLTADYSGNVYALWKKSGPTTMPGDTHRASSLYRYDPRGQLLSAPLVDCQFPSIYSPRIDRAGNIYLAVGLRPGKDLLAPGLAGQAPDSKDDPAAVNNVNAYPLVYGSVVKFPPTGGAIRDGIGGVECNYGAGWPIQVKGAQWIVAGVSEAGSFAVPKRTAGTLITCVCEFPNIDVDEFGRTFFPDAARCRVGVVDTAGNEICFFGGYGNGDSAGPGSAVPTPAIPMWWPQAVAVDDAHAYVGDRLNRRLLAVKLDYAAKAECPLP